ncbi:hypothetical protein ACTWQB_00690 [Piscibacillus sp. B03]|uniref:hypothetical protein n=1 Tax=Piscibacillus sp. B03 TaxID=3457430 RepID=UPI003FCEAD2E
MKNNNKRVTIKNTRAWSLVFMNLLFGTFSSMFPSENLTLWKVNMLIGLAVVIVMMLLINVYRYRVKMYNDLVAYAMFMMLGFYGIIPLFRIYIETGLIWSILVVTLVCLILFHVRREKAYKVLQVVTAFKWKKPLFIMFVMMAVFLVYLLNGNPGHDRSVVVFSYISFVVSMVWWWLAAPLSIRLERKEELKVYMEQFLPEEIQRQLEEDRKYFNDKVE